LGGQLGRNWQFGRTVLGVEGDASWAHTRARTTLALNDPFGLVTQALTYTTQIDWMASLRARAGYTWDRLLVYGTGGVALIGGRINSSFVLNNPIPLIVFPNPGFSGTTTASSSFTKVGWTIGAGLEWAFNDKWSLAGEYRYSYFGRRTFTLASPDPSGQLGFTPITTSMRLATDQATLRLNYRFGGR
jgi:outer membrane immunogenic protein